MATAIYARQSLDRNGEGTAVARQIEDCKKLAQLREVSVDYVLTDNDVSATKGPRPGWKQLLELVESGDVDTIIVWHTDRLYRRLPDAVSIVVLAEKHNLNIWTVRAGDIDLSTPTGRGIAIMMAAAARMEVEHKGERQKTANQARAAKGESLHFSQRPYGYERVDGEIHIVEAEAAILREAVNRVVAGESWYAIAKDFKARGVRTPDREQKSGDRKVLIPGRAFSYQNLMQRATNPAIAGIRVYLGEVKNEDGKWPAIIDRVTWDRMQNVLANRRRVQTWDTKIKYLGSRLYVCGKCGGRMVVSRDHNAERTPVYQCENLDTRRNLAKVDELVEAAIVDRLGQSDVLRMLSPEADLSAIASESIEVRARISGLAELYADGILSAQDVRDQKARLQQRLLSLQEQLNISEGGRIIAELASAESVASFWATEIDIHRKRRVVDALLKVTIMPTKRGGTNQFRPEDVTIELRS